MCHFLARQCIYIIKSSSDLSQDTDSIFVALSVPWSEIARPETADYYWNTIHPKWFCDDPTSDKAKTPGIFKTEWEITDGSYVGLSSKCYSIHDRKNPEKVKKATKGKSNSWSHVT